MIHTRLHKLLEQLENPGQVTEPKLFAALQMLVPLLKSTPHYVLTPELIEVVQTNIVDSTVDALMDAGVARLPYGMCLVEMRQQCKQGGWGHSFLLCQQHNTGPKWDCFFLYMHDDGGVQSLDRPVTLSLTPYNPDTDAGLERVTKYVWETSHRLGTIGITTAAAVGVLLTLTHTRGVVKETVTSERLAKLNKSRAGKGKQPVLPYTVYRIGHTYTATGEKVTYAPGCKRRPHLRAGHTRMQRYGTGRQLEKLIFIEPILVNCESEADVPMFKPKVVTW